MQTNTGCPEGTVIGHPANGPVEPPQPLDPVAWSPGKRDNSAGEVERIAICASFMREQFRESAGRAIPPEREYNVRWAAWRVLEAGGDPVGYVRYVVEQHRARRGRRPLWQQVFGQKAVDGWLPEYTRRQAEGSDRASYEAPPERRAEYAERMKQDLLP